MIGGRAALTVGLLGLAVTVCVFVVSHATRVSLYGDDPYCDYIGVSGGRFWGVFDIDKAKIEHPWEGRFAGFHLAVGELPRFRSCIGSPGSLRFAIPLWCPLLLLTVYPSIAFIRGPLRRYRRRRKRGLCVRCGYNLTGNVSGVCPECGTPV